MQVNKQHFVITQKCSALCLRGKPLVWSNTRKHVPPRRDAQTGSGEAWGEPCRGVGHGKLRVLTAKTEMGWWEEEQNRGRGGMARWLWSPSVILVLLFQNPAWAVPQRLAWKRPGRKPIGSQPGKELTIREQGRQGWTEEVAGKDESGTKMMLKL